MAENNLVVYYGMRLKKTDNGYFCNGAFGRYIDELSNHYTKIFLVMPTLRINNSDEFNEYKLKSKNIVVQEITGYTGYVSALKYSRVIKSELKIHSKLWECPVYIRWPVPFFQFVYKIAQKKRLPVCFHLVGDSRSVVAEGSKYKGIFRFLALKYADYNSKIMSSYIKVNPTLVNGNGLRRLYDKNNVLVREIRTSTFSSSEIVTKVKDIDKNHIKLLYVGYLRHEKGIKYLLKAVKILNDQNFNIRLTVIGEGDILEDLLKIISDLNIENYVSFEGYIPLGNELFKKYEENDILVLPSISEGTPRVLIEAMSKGLPVIATNVGGIPFTIKNNENGILVDSKSSDQLSEAIIDVINNDTLRKRIINNGLEFAKENTIESHVNEVVGFLKQNSDLKDRCAK